MHFTVLRSKAVSRYICDEQHQPPLVEYMSTTRQIQCFRLQWALKTWFELSRVKVYRKWPEGKRKLVRVSGSSSYRGFELPRVKLQWTYDGNPGEIDFGLSEREVRVSEGSSYRESTVLALFFEPLQQVTVFTITCVSILFSSQYQAFCVSSHTHCNRFDFKEKNFQEKKFWINCFLDVMFFCDSFWICY